MNLLQKVFLVTTLLVGGAQAARITWQNAQNITGDADVYTAGTSVCAYAAGGSATVNGVAFAQEASLQNVDNAQIKVNSLTSIAPAAFASSNSPFKDLPEDYKTILKGAAYSDNSVTTTITFKNLTVGVHYVIQVWVSDPRSASPKRGTKLIGANEVTLYHCAPDNIAGQAGQFVLGTFVADATTQDFSVKGINNSSQINALQLRSTDVFVCTTKEDVGWWDAGVWNGRDWVNSTSGNDSLAYINMTASKSMQVVTPEGGSDVLLSALTVANTTDTTTLEGDDLTFTSAAPFIDLRPVTSATFELIVKNRWLSDNPITFHSVGTAPGGPAATGGIRFVKTPQLGAIIMQSGHILLSDDGLTGFTDTIILRGGGICSRNNNETLNFPLKVDHAGGWWRTYGNANKVFTGTLADLDVGNTGVFYHSDGGTLTLAGDLSGFSGTLRNDGGTLRLGNGNAVSNYVLQATLAGTSDISLNLNGDASLTKAINLQATLKKEGTSDLNLDLGNNLEHEVKRLGVYGGSMTFVGGLIQSTTDMDIHGGNLFLTNDSKIVASNMVQVGNSRVEINGGELNATHANIVNYSDNRVGTLCLNAGRVNFSGVNYAVNASDGGVASPFRVGHWSNGKGSLQVKGGEMYSQDQSITISWDSPGELLIEDGLLDCYALMLGSPTRKNKADFMMSGGVFKLGAGGFYRRSNDTTCIFTGGTLASTAPFTFHGDFTLGTAATDQLQVDTSAGDITLAGSVTGSGTLVKTGTGVLFLRSLAVPLTVTKGSVWAPAETITLPALTTTADETVLGLRLAANAASGSTRYVVDGDVVLANGTLLDIILTQGSFDINTPYTIIESINGTITLEGEVVVPGWQEKGVTVTVVLAQDAKSLSLQWSVDTKNFYWKGGSEGSWDYESESWSLDQQATTPNTAFTPFGNAFFDTISGENEASVVLGPSAMDVREIVVQGTTSYTLSGAELTGALKLTKKGESTLTLATIWPDMAPIDLQNGILNWQSPVTLAASHITANAGTTLALNHNAAKITATDTLWSGVNVKLGSGVLEVASNGLVDPLAALEIQDGSLRIQSGASMTKPFTVSGVTGSLDTSAVGNSVNFKVEGKITGTGNLGLRGNGSTADSGGGVGGNLQLSNAVNDFRGDVVLLDGVITAESQFGHADNPIVLNGGGTVRTSGAITLNRDLLVDQNGGVLRCYSNLGNQQIWTARFANRTAETVPGDVRQTDGGTIQFLGDISGFTGNYRKVGGGTARLVIGNGSALPCAGMPWNSIYFNQERAVFNLANQDFLVKFATAGGGALYKQGTGSLLWTNTASLAHTGGTFIEGGALRMKNVTQFADGTTITIAEGAMLEHLLNTGALNTGTRKIKGSGTFRFALDTQSGADLFKASTEFNGVLDLHCQGAAKLISLGTTQFGSATTIAVNPGALWFVTSNATFPYHMRIAGIGNNEVDYGFGALRLENTPTMQGTVALMDDARIFGSANFQNEIFNDCETVKTLSLGGTYKTGHTMDFNGPVNNGRAPLNLEFLHANTFNFNHAANHVAAITNLASTIKVNSGAGLTISQPSAGAGKWLFAANSVLGISLAAGDAGRLDTTDLTWDVDAKLNISGLDGESQLTRTTVLSCPPSAITGVPTLAAPLPWPWALKRHERDGTAFFDIVNIGGTIILVR